MENLFGLKKHDTTVRTEILGGITTFFAMAYIIFVNPDFLSQTGMDFHAVLIATCLSAAIGCFLTAFLANVPFAQAPGMGLNAFFTYTVCLGMGYSWQQGLTIVLISGVLFLAIAVSPIRSKVIASLPACLKRAIGAGIGLFIALIGLLNTGIITMSSGVPALGNIARGAPLLAILGVLITGGLLMFKVKGAIFIGIIVTTLIGFPMGVTKLPETLTTGGINFTATMFKLDFGGLLSHGVLPLITAIVTFAIVDCFDTVGTLIGTAHNNGMLDKDGNLPGGDRALIADAIATCTGALLGTSTVTTYVESSTGISEGARTGLAAAVVGVLFLLAMFLAPIAGIIPSAATAPALIIVGMLMIKSAADIHWGDVEEALPSFLTIAVMPFSYSIANGIAFGVISYTLLKLVRGKAKQVPVLLYILSALFILMFVLSSL